MRHCAVALFLSLCAWVLPPGVHGKEQVQPSWWGQISGEAQRDGYDLITPDSLQKMYDSGKDFLILDVRPNYEYSDGHLPKAVNLEFDPGDQLQLSPEKRGAFVKLLGPDKTRKIIIYCRSFR